MGGMLDGFKWLTGMGIWIYDTLDLLMMDYFMRLNMRGGLGL